MGNSQQGRSSSKGQSQIKRVYRWWAGMGLGVWLVGLGAAAQAADPTVSVSDGVSWLEAIGLGLVQGLTEFLPISSTAHLKVVPVVLGWGDPGVAYTAVIQLGSIAAVLTYFWADLTALAIGSAQAISRKDWGDRQFRIALGIGLGTLPIVAGGLAIKKFIPDFDNSPLRSLGAIAIASIVMALLLGLAEVTGSRHRHYNALGLNDGLILGAAQALALIPGVSRSGSTLTAGLLSGIDRAAAARFSFLLGIPAITLAGLVELVGVLKEGLPAGAGLSLTVGVVVSAVSSYAAIAWLLKFLQTQNTWVFVIYRLIFGVAILGSIGFGWLPNQ
ncbi:MULTISPECIES: undecaprenyl-diphosphate phosphatase [unclassified Limnothrix]|uniref:undecaprenyl-diphosphate phosphatase n=2 Tax=unclassified Limnothrix TaxID=2632864 RepID=UPI001F54E7FF|nr:MULTISPECIES: undecaprenyl-diphosphate phosphatase [unclassified Limnothrix]